MTSLHIGQRRINRFITESGEPGSGHSLILTTNVSKKTLCLEPRPGEGGVNPTVAPQHKRNGIQLLEKAVQSSHNALAVVWKQKR
jgi:hypothetical protein